MPGRAKHASGTGALVSGSEAPDLPTPDDSGRGTVCCGGRAKNSIPWLGVTEASRPLALPLPLQSYEAAPSPSRGPPAHILLNESRNHQAALETLLPMFRASCAASLLNVMVASAPEAMRLSQPGVGLHWSSKANASQKWQQFRVSNS